MKNASPLKFYESVACDILVAMSALIGFSHQKNSNNQWYDWKWRLIPIKTTTSVLKVSIYRTRCDTGDNFCLGLQNYRHSVCNIIFLFFFFFFLGEGGLLIVVVRWTCQFDWFIFVFQFRDAVLIYFLWYNYY